MNQNMRKNVLSFKKKKKKVKIASLWRRSRWPRRLGTFLPASLDLSNTCTATKRFNFSPKKSQFWSAKFWSIL